MARGDDVIVADTMFDWARDASSPAFARKRLSVGRRFAVWLHAEKRAPRGPSPTICSGRPRNAAPPPHLLTNAEIRSLMAAALSLPPKGSITPHTLHCTIGLMATTGLHRSPFCHISAMTVGRFSVWSTLTSFLTNFRLRMQIAQRVHGLGSWPR